MSLNLFTQDAGKTVAMQMKGQTALISFGDGDLNALIVESLEAPIQENYQAQRSFSGDIYVTTFGTTLMPMRIVGRHPVSFCTNTTQVKLADYYNKAKVSKSGAAVSITCAGITIKGFITGLTMIPINNQTFTGYQFQISLMGQQV